MGSRSSLPQNENTLSGLVVPSWLLCLPSKPCGSLRPNMTKLVHPSSTENVSKHFIYKSIQKITILFLYALFSLSQNKKSLTLSQKKKICPPKKKKKKKKKKS